MSELSELRTDYLSGHLVKYRIDNYGETGDFFYQEPGVLPVATNERISRSGIPPEYVYKRGRDFDWDLYSEDVTGQKKLANAFISKFEQFRSSGRGLYIYSNTKGSGKTMLACCIANELLQRIDISVKFISTIEYIELVKDKLQAAADERNSIFYAGLLILDDIGTALENKEWVSNALYRLVNRRYENILPTIYTSNVEREALKCDDRIVSRIYSSTIPIMMPESNIRKMKADESEEKFLRDLIKQ